jgi:hypothetical protein
MCPHAVFILYSFVGSENQRVNVYVSAFKCFSPMVSTGAAVLCFLCDNWFSQMQMEVLDKPTGNLAGGMPWPKEKDYYVIDPAMGLSAPGKEVAVFPHLQPSLRHTMFSRST